jgi:hypothetical protein
MSIVERSGTCPDREDLGKVPASDRSEPAWLNRMLDCTAKRNRQAERKETGPKAVIMEQLFHSRLLAFVSERVYRPQVGLVESKSQLPIAGNADVDIHRRLAGLPDAMDKLRVRPASTPGTRDATLRTRSGRFQFTLVRYRSPAFIVSNRSMNAS